MIERRYIGHNSSHNTPIATPSPLGRADELWSHGLLDADRLAPTNRGTARDLQTSVPAVRVRVTRRLRRVAVVRDRPVSLRRAPAAVGDDVDDSESESD